MYLGSIGNLNQNLQAMTFNLMLVYWFVLRRIVDRQILIGCSTQPNGSKSSQYIQSMVDKKIVVSIIASFGVVK